MAMRITTKMMQNTAIRNLNTNKMREQKLTEQMATGKKISRPSDDPVIAIRSLKLNSSLDKIIQYSERNAADAESWIDLTESAISTVIDTVKSDTGLKALVTQAAAQYETAEDRMAIMQDLLNKVKEIYSTGNADSSGRSIFTGFRTDLPLTFTQDKTENYRIIEQITNEVMNTVTFVSKGDLTLLNEGNYNDIETTEYDVDTYEIPRIRLSYDDTETLEKVTTDVISVPELNEDGMPIVDSDPDSTTDFVMTTTTISTYEPNITLSYVKDGIVHIYSANPTGVDEEGHIINNYDEYGYQTNKIVPFHNATEEAYKYAVEHPDEIVYIAETGELLLGSNVQEELARLSVNDEIRVSYEKTNWEEGDLDPIHYFYTERTDERTGRTLKYNEQYLEGDRLLPDDRQIIEYDIGNNQRIRVNTTPDELFTHDIGRDVEDLVAMLEEYYVVADNYDIVDNLIESGEPFGESLERLEKQKAALQKAKNLVSDKIQERTEKLLTICDDYLEKVVLAGTNNGARGSRLEVIKNRLSVQQGNFEELVSTNEDADYDELTIQLKSIQLTYNAALSSIAFVMQNSLLDYIR